MPAAFSSPLAQALAADVLERFSRYVQIDTQSSYDRERSPSTPGQLELARLLAGELEAIGLTDARVD
ncbi:MAG: peptidase T, partial [Actinomycetota bacterium]|nr:peptidase T [Actinomycetota bacterium]